MSEKRRKNAELGKIEKKLHHRFKKKDILRNALTHPSSLSEHANLKSYEVMEFFGDSILSFVISEMIYRKRAGLSEGEMTRIRSMIVSAKSLAKEAKKLDIGRFIFFGKGEEKTGGREKESILSATFEALVAAIYLDGGIMRVRRFLKGIFEKNVNSILRSGKKEFLARDSKSVLQELLHKRGEPLPEYVVMREQGPPHDKLFSVELRIGGKPVSEGEGKTKKEAEKEAARNALIILMPSS